MAWFSRKTHSALPSSAEPSSTAPLWKYDVFLSFRRLDTLGFTSNLYDRLRRRGFIVFFNDEGLEKWDETSILKAIEESTFAIVVLSPNYTFSPWCLKELTQIVHKWNSDDFLFLPVFYHVYPRAVIRDVDQYEITGQYKREEVQQWRDALTEVAQLSGFRIELGVYQEEVTNRIVDFIQGRQVEIETADFELDQAKRQGMDEILKVLKDDEVTAVGVSGMAGVGKTVLVDRVGKRAQYNGLFDHVITAVVTQSPDLRIIQGTLADQLGIKLEASQFGVNLEETTESRRAAARLSEEIITRSKILIILEDIWERIDLSSIGVPSNKELQKRKSKVLLTTRNVCHVMECQENITLSTLSDEDSCTVLVSDAERFSRSTNTGDFQALESTRPATVETEPTMPKSSKDFEPTTQATNGKSTTQATTQAAKVEQRFRSNNTSKISLLFLFVGFLIVLVPYFHFEAQPVVEINTGDLEAVEVTRRATIEIEPTMLQSNEDVEVTSQATIEIEPTTPQSSKDFETVEASQATTEATNGNSPQWKHDVFLSFNGEDTRAGFLSHLYHELENTKVIRTFKDDEQLEKGKDISQGLLKAIEESRFAIIVLSKNYAFSAWCLDELTKIVQCMEGKNTILPIFFHVDPSDVRYQKNSYEEAFKKHESKARHAIDKVKQWRADLTKVGNLFGWDLRRHRSERELIEHIVKFVRKKVLEAPWDIDVC